jgi:hypothetical protein
LTGLPGACVRGFQIIRAALEPVAVFRARSVHVAHINSWKLLLRDGLWNLPDVRDVTDELTAITPSACFRDRGMIADESASGRGKPLVIRELKCLNSTKCDWRFFDRARRPAATKRPSLMIRRVGRAETTIASSYGALHTNSFYIVVLDERGAFDLFRADRINAPGNFGVSLL